MNVTADDEAEDSYGIEISATTREEHERSLDA